MREQFQFHELTPKTHSSTLNTTRLNTSGNFPMPEPSQPEQPPREPEPNHVHPKTNPETRSPIDSVGELLISQNPQAAREVARVLVETAKQTQTSLTPEQVKFIRETGYVPVITVGADVPGNEGWEPDRGEGRPQEPLGQVTAPEDFDRQINNIVEIINRDLKSHRIKIGDESSLDTLRDYRNKFIDRITSDSFPLEKQDVAREILGQIDDVELRLQNAVAEAGRGTDKDQNQYRLLHDATKLESDYEDVIKALREGRQVDPEREREFRRKKQDLVKKIIEEVEAETTPSLEAGRFPTALMHAALKFKETRELLINEIIFKPYDDVTEQGHYEINFYASGSLDELLAAMSKLAKRSKEDRDIYQKYKGIKTTARNFWEMNRGLWTGNLETFSRIAEEMNYEQFDLMKNLPGVGEVMRLYDQKLYEELGRSGGITSEGFDRVKKEVEKSFRAMNDRGLVKSAYYEDREGTGAIERDRELGRKKFHEWEIMRALSVGKVYYNISFRSAEVIALSRINEASGGKAYTSFPLENAARIMDARLTAKRFGMGEKLGGMELWDNAGEAYRELLIEDRRHLGHNRFTYINGVNVADLEFAASTGISGIFSGWRMFYALYPAYKFKLQEDGVEKEMDLEHIMDKRAMMYKNKKVTGLIKYIDEGIKKDNSLSMEQKQQAIADALAFLIGDNGKLKTGLGAFLRIAQGNQGTGMLGGEIGFKARQQIWKRIAETNHLATINILTGLRESNGKDKDGKPLDKESDKSLRRILKDQGWITEGEYKIENPDDDWYYLNTPRWTAFKEKLQLIQEVESKKQIDPTFTGYDVPELEADEKELLKVITETFTNADVKGKVMTQDMADIIFPFMTFMNDVPYEHLTWENVGAQFFKRRFGDIGSYNSAVSKGIFPLLDNIGGMKPEDVVCAFKELFNGIKSPNGEDSGWGAVLPWELAYLQMGMTYAGPDSWAPIKDAKAILKKETSRLQHYAGTNAPSLSKEQAYGFLHQMRLAGVMSHNMEELIRKKRRITLADLIWAFIMDVVPMVVLDMAVGVIKAPISQSQRAA